MNLHTVAVITHSQISTCNQHTLKLEALRERRPPWPRQIITPILPTVKMLSLGGERLTPPPLPPPPPKKKKKKKSMFVSTFFAVEI